MIKRLDLLDSTKGICIILMTISHFPGIAMHTFITWINHTVFMAFKMPLFFMISGYLVSMKGNLKTFLLGKADALLKTSLNITLLFCFFIFVKSRDIDILIHLGKSLANGTVFPVEVALYPLWFPIALFISLFIVRWMMVMELRWNKIHFVPAVILVYAVLVGLYRYNVGFYFLNTLVFSVAFIHFGTMVRNYVHPEQLELFCGRRNIFLLSLVVFSTLCVFSNSLHINLDIGIASGQKLGNHLLLTLVKTLTGSYILLYLALQLGRVVWLKDFLISCARASFIILAFHIKVTAMLFKLLNHFDHHLHFHFLIFVVNILVCLILFKVINKLEILRMLFLPSYGKKAGLKLINSRSLITLLRQLSNKNQRIAIIDGVKTDAKNRYQYLALHLQYVKEIFSNALNNAFAHLFQLRH